MAEINKARLIELAEAKLEDAKLLLSTGRAANAYYLAGYSVELMLKTIVSARFRTDTLPDRAVSTQVFVHDLRKLIGLALLEVALKEREKADAGFRLACKSC
jgi:HEPN domain-containing protein